MMEKALPGRSARLPSRELVFCAALALTTVCHILDSTVVPPMLGETFSETALKAFRYVSYLLAAVSLLMNRSYSRRSLVLILAVLALAVVNARTAGNLLMLSLLFAAGIVGLDYRRVARVQLAVMIATFAFVVLSSLIGLVDNWGFELDSARPRYCLGFYYPSHATSLFFYIVLLFCALKGRELRLWHVLVIAALDLWQFHYTDARAGTLLALAAPAVMYLLRRRPVPPKHISWVLELSFVLCAAASLLITWVYAKELLDLSWLNRLLSSRLDLQRDAFAAYHVGLFGQQIDWIGYGGTGYTHAAVGDSYNFIDCSYLKVLFDQGVLMWAVVLLGFTAACFRASKQGDYPLLLALSFSALYCAVEQWLIRPGYHPFFILIGALFLIGTDQPDHRIRFSGAKAGEVRS